MAENHYVMGNTAIARGAIESGVRVVAGYPGTPATEIVEDMVGYSSVHLEWSSNEKVAFEIATGASLCHVRSMAVMKHNGTNVVTDFLMHVNFTGVRAGLVLISADDPGGLSSRTRRTPVFWYTNMPIFPSSTLVLHRRPRPWSRMPSTFLKGPNWYSVFAR